MSNFTNRGKNYLNTVTEGNDGGGATPTRQVWLSILETYIACDNFLTLEQIYDFNTYFELRTYEGLSQGLVFVTGSGERYSILSIYVDKYTECMVGDITNYGIYILVCNEHDRMISLGSYTTYNDIFYNIIREEPTNPDYAISFTEWWYRLQPEGIGEVIDLIGGGCENLSTLPENLNKCTEDVKVLTSSLANISNLISTETVRVKALINQFTDKDHDGVNVIERILSRIEDFSLLVIGLITCTSVKTAVIMCLQYYKTFVKGPALLQIVKTLTSFFDYMKAVMKDKVGLKAEGLPEFEATGFVVLDVVKWLGKNWHMLMEGEVLKYVSNAITILMAFICGDEKTEEFVNEKTFNLFKVRTWDFSKGAKGFIDMLLATLQFFLEKGLLVMQTGNIGAIFYTDKTWHEIEIELNSIIVWSKLIGTNQLNTIAEKSEGEFTSEEDYRCRLFKLKDKLYEYHKIEKNQKSRAVISGYLLKLGSINVALQMQKKSASFKEAPFCVMLYGESAIAKSLLMNVTAKCIAQANGWPGDFENICSPNEADEYDTEYNDELHTVLFIDDILNTKPEWYKKPPTDRILRVKNNAPQTVLKADVESKGAMMWLVKLLVLSTNVKSLKAHIFSNLAASIMRRIDLVVCCYLKDEYKDELGCFKNTSGEMLPSAWEFLIQQVKITSREEVDANCDYCFEDVYSTGEISEYLKFISFKSRLHTLKQKNIVNEVKQMFDSGFCPHFKVKCECDKCCKSDDPLNTDTLSDAVWDDPNMLSYKEKKMITSASEEEDLEPEGNLEPEGMPPLPSLEQMFDKDRKADGLRGTVIPPEHYTWDGNGNFIYHPPEEKPCDHVMEKVKDEKKSFGEIFKELYSTVNDGSVKILDQLKEHWQTLAAATAVVGIISVIRGAISIADTAESIGEQEPTMMPGERQNVWVARKLKRVPLMIRRTKESSSTTYTDLKCKISRSMFCAKVQLNGTSTCFNICPMEDNYWLAPFHSVNHQYPLRITVTNCQNDETGVQVTEMLSKNAMRRVRSTDYAIIRLKCIQPRKGFYNFFPCEPIIGNDMVATCVYRPRRDWFSKQINPQRDRALEYMEESMDVGGCYSSLVRVEGRAAIDVPGHMKYEGFRYKPDHITFNGLCGMTMILQARGAVVMGMHLAGDGQEGIIGSISQPDIRCTIDEFTEDYLPLRGEGGITSKQYGYSFEQPALEKEGLYDDDIGPKHCTRFMDVTQPTAIEIYGPHEKGTRTLRSDVKQSLISETVEEIMDLPRIHGKPKGLGSWKPFQQNAQTMMSPGNDLDPDILQECVDDLVEHHMKVINDNDLAKHIHFVSEDVAINGVPGMTGFDRIDMSTSAGHPYDGPKSKLIDYEKSDIDEYGTINKVVFEQEVYDNVENLRQKAINGERLYTIFRANVKDEATKFSKDKLRVFAGTSLDYLILCKQALGALNRVIQMHWEKFECCISANCYDDDWTKLYNSTWQPGCEDRFFCGDYEHWDKGLFPQILCAGAGVTYEICRRCGFSEQQLMIVSAVLQELVYPIYEWDGVYAQFLCSLPSGVFVTVMMSNSCNSLLFRYTFYSRVPRQPDCILKYDVYIKANFMGDDNFGTVSTECTWWTQRIHAEVMAKHGIIYTAADKKSELKDFYHRDEATYLKRKFVWNERLQQYLAPIEETSLQKTLHNYMRRKKSQESLESYSGSAIDHCIREYFRMGEEIYNRRSQELLEIVKKHNLWKNCSLIKNNAAFPTYDEMCTDYLQAISFKKEERENQIKAESEAAKKPPIASMKMSSLNEERTIENVAGAAVTEIAHFCDNNIKPEGISEKLGVTFRSNKQDTSQIVSFTDLVEQNTYDVVCDNDETFSMQDASQDDIAGFFSRPIKIYTTDIEINTALKVKFDPWTLFFTNLRVVNRMCNFNLLRCNLKLRFLINGNSFYYGRFIASYLPLASQDELAEQTVTNRFIDHVTLASQRPHIYIDPTTSQGGEMTLPFFYYNSNISIPLQEWAEMGTVFIDTISNLQHANGGTEDVKLSVFAYAEDVKLSIPTSVEPAALSPQGCLEPEAKDEVELVTGKVSGPASALAKGAATIAMYPPIKPYAMAASYVAEAIAGVARLFGYSRPKLSCNPPCRYKPEYFGTLANTDVAENISCTALDSKQEVTIDPRVAGLSSADEMTVASIVAHESYFHSMTWSIADSTETCLGQVRVDPALYRQLSNGKYLTSTAFASLPFKYWTGTLKFRFQIICSGFHRGRLRIVYDPVSLLATSDEYNVNYTQVVDISETQDITVSIPPCQHRPIMESVTIATPTTSLYTTTGTALAASTTGGNGVLSVYVVNDLTIPASTAADVSIAVFVSADDDFAVWNPYDGMLGGMVLKPEGIEEGDVELSTNTPVGEQVVGMVDKPSDSIYDKLAMIYTGENVPSIRSWVKRYCHHFSWGGDGSNTGPNRIALQTSAFPFNRGNVTNAVHSRVAGPGIAPYNFCNTTILNYLSWAYVGWRGSLRWKIGLTDKYSNDGGASQELSLLCTRQPEQAASDYAYSITPIAADNNESTNAYRMLSRSETFWDGVAVTPVTDNPVVEIDIPYYSDKRFQLCRLQDRTSSSYAGVQRVPGKASFIVATASSASGGVISIDEYVSAGDDFSLLFYIGPPVLYFEQEWPAPDGGA